MHAWKADGGKCGEDDGFLCCVPLMVDFTGSLDWPDFVVFLKLQWGRCNVIGLGQ